MTTKNLHKILLYLVILPENLAACMDIIPKAYLYIFYVQQTRFLEDNPPSKL